MLPSFSSLLCSSNLIDDDRLRPCTGSSPSPRNYQLYFIIHFFLLTYFEATVINPSWDSVFDSATKSVALDNLTPFAVTGHHFT